MRRTTGFDALGFTFCITADDTALLDDITRPFAALAGTTAEHEYELVANGSDGFAIRFADEHVGTAADPGDLVTALVHDVTRRALALTDLMVMHAGGVSDGGVVLGLPGAPGAGKTTLVAGLLRRRLGYVTDEALAVDPATLEVVAYPKPLSMKAGAAELFPELVAAGVLPVGPLGHGERQVAPGDLSARVAMCGQPIGVFVFPRRGADGASRLERLSRAEAIVDAAHQTFGFAEQARTRLDLLAEIVRGAECWRLTIGSLDSAVDALGELIGADRVGEPA